jgi:hypothetical protein
MASTFSTNLAIELIGTGDQAGTWGTTTNSNLGTLIEQAISGYVTQAVATGTDTTITIPNGSTGVARNMYIELTGTGGASTNLIVPANKKLYFIFNNSTGAVTVKVSGQTGVSVPTGKKMVLVSNGTDIVNGLNYIADFGTNSFSVTNLTASSATITNLIATSGSITNLVSSDASATVLRAGSATLTHLSATSASITNLALTSLTISSLSITNVSVASATVSSNLTLSGGTANGVLYLNGSKVATSGSALTFDGTQTFSLFATGNAVTNLEGSTTNNAILRFRNGTTGNLAGFYGNNSKELIFEANGATEQMRLTSTGLGIGTSSPGAPLNVKKNSAGAVVEMLRLTNDGPGAGSMSKITFDASGTAYAAITGGFGTGGPQIKFELPTSTGGSWDWIYQSTTLATLLTSGNLCIGTSSPITKLDVRSDAAVVTVSGYSSLHFNALPASATARAATIRKNYDSPFDFNIYASTGTSGNSAATIFYRDITNESMRLDSSGNLFVGGTNGNARLTVRGSGTTSATASIEGATSGGASRFLVSDDGLCRWYGTSNAETMRLDNAGNLGIGTTANALTHPLTLYASGSTSRYMAVGNSNTGLNGTVFGIDGSGNTAINNTQNLAMLFLTNNTERARITSGGDFGIGNTNPLYRLTVDKDTTSALGFFTNSNNSTPNGIRIDFSAASPDNNTQYFLYCEDSTTARVILYSDGDGQNHDNSWGGISDERLKQDIVDANSQWDDIKNLRVRKYRFKSDVENGKEHAQIGLIAQEVMPVSPGLVIGSEDTQYGVQYSILYMKAVKALQEAMARIEQLEAKVAALESK